MLALEGEGIGVTRAVLNRLGVGSGLGLGLGLGLGKGYPNPNPNLCSPG